MSLSLALTIINLLASMHTTEGQDFPKASEEKNVRSRKRKEILLQQEVCHCAPKKKEKR